MTISSNRSKWLKLATFALAVSLVATACGGGNSSSGNNNSNSGTPTATAPADNNAEKPDEPSGEQGEAPSGEQGEAPANEQDLKTFADKIIADLQMGEFMEVENAQVADFYKGIDLDAMIEEGLFLTPMFNISATEFSIVKLKSEDDYEAVKAAFEFRAETVQQGFKEYLQDQYKLAQEFQIVRNGDYVLFSISNTQKEIADIFNGFFE